MGLDMYINKFPRYKNTTAKQVNAIEHYIDWQVAKANGDEYANCTFEEWCGVSIYDLPSQDVVDFYKQFYSKKYSSWDVEKKYGYCTIHEQVGYFRKANQIHNWMVENVQDGEDDCQYHHELTKELVEELLDICEKVYQSCTMMIGYVKNGEQYKDGKWETIYEVGKTVIDTSLAEALLPTASGFFFGGTDYDEYYVKDLEYTIELCHRLLETTDFDKEMLAYISSW